MTFACELFEATLHEARSCFSDPLCFFFLMTPRGFERLCLQHAAKERMHKSKENASTHCEKMFPKWFQNLSKIDPGGGLEATWEPPLKQGAFKTSLFMILAPFWDPLWDQFGFILGIMF